MTIPQVSTTVAPLPVGTTPVAPLPVPAATTVAPSPSIAPASTPVTAPRPTVPSRRPSSVIPGFVTRPSIPEASTPAPAKKIDHVVSAARPVAATVVAPPVAKVAPSPAPAIAPAPTPAARIVIPTPAPPAPKLPSSSPEPEIEYEEDTLVPLPFNESMLDPSLFANDKSNIDPALSDWSAPATGGLSGIGSGVIDPQLGARGEDRMDLSA